MHGAVLMENDAKPSGIGVSDAAFHQSRAASACSTRFPSTRGVADGVHERIDPPLGEGCAARQVVRPARLWVPDAAPGRNDRDHPLLEIDFPAPAILARLPGDEPHRLGGRGRCAGGRVHDLLQGAPRMIHRLDARKAQDRIHGRGRDAIAIWGLGGAEHRAGGGEGGRCAMALMEAPSPWLFGRASVNGPARRPPFGARTCRTEARTRPARAKRPSAARSSVAGTAQGALYILQIQQLRRPRPGGTTSVCR